MEKNKTSAFDPSKDLWRSDCGWSPNAKRSDGTPIWSGGTTPIFSSNIPTLSFEDDASSSRSTTSDAFFPPTSSFPTSGTRSPSGGTTSRSPSGSRRSSSGPLGTSSSTTSIIPTRTSFSVPAGDEVPTAANHHLIKNNKKSKSKNVHDPSPSSSSNNSPIKSTNMRPRTNSTAARNNLVPDLNDISVNVDEVDDSQVRKVQKSLIKRVALKVWWNFWDWAV